MRIEVLGPTVVVHEGVRLSGGDLGGGKPRQLLEMLALSLGTPMPKDRLADRLWDGRPPTSYVATVESYVCGLRRRIGLPGGRRGALATTSHGYVLDPDQVDVDYWEVRGLLLHGDHDRGGDRSGDRGGDAGGRQGADDAARLLDLLPGELLADEPYASWATEAREGFAEVVTATCVAAARAANARGEPALAVRLADEARRHSYLSEPALRELMAGLVRTGDRVRALHAYETLRVGLRDELGLEPEEATQRQYLDLLRDHGGHDGRSADRDEIGALLHLLRRALEEDTAQVLGLPAMSEVGRLLLARCG